MRAVATRVIVVLAALMGAHAMAVAEDPQTPPDAAIVTLDVFSGRPNPDWPLTAAQTAELRRRLDALPAGEAVAPSDDGLGYRGLRVVLPGPEGESVATIGGGRVLVEGCGRRSGRLDPERGVEAWLVETGAGRLPADLLDYTRKAIAPATR